MTQSKTYTLETFFAPAERAEKELVYFQSRILLETANLEKLLGSITDMVVILNRERQIVFANKAFMGIVGSEDIQSICGLCPGEALDCVHASESSGGCGTTEFCRTCGAVKAILSAQRGMEDVQECRVVQKESGDALDLLIKTSILESHGERFVIVAVRDISHEKRRRLLERLFFHDVMNTALGVKGLVELLEIADPDQLDEFRQMISRAAINLVEEIKAQRDMAAAENNELICTLGTVDTHQLLQQMEELYRTHGAARGKSVCLSETAHALEMQTDRVLLMRVLGNMLKNALEASIRGDTVTIGCDRIGGGNVRFWVHNPSYIERDYQLQIFQRSFSTKGIDRGIGTYSMKLLSERYLKGTVCFESSPEGGTVFSAVYPLSYD